MAVAMELLPSNWKHLSSSSPSEEALRSIQQKLHVLRTHGIVHGDLHASNILVNEAGEVRVVDFDWAFDMEGEDPTVYPAFLNSALPWAPGAASNSPITAEHDAFLIDSMGDM